MLFTSLEFFGFLALALMGYAALPARLRWGWLLLASAVFYGAARPSNLAFLGGLALVVWMVGAALDRGRSTRARRIILAGGLALVVGSLVAFKFQDFLAGELERALGAANGTIPRLGFAAPAGYSFYAFTGAAYLVDAFGRRVPGRPGPAAVALHLAWFPKLLAGPIERAGAFLPQLYGRLRADPERLVLGLQLTGWGLFKKVVIADNLAPFVDRAFAIPAYAAPLDLAIAVYFFAFQIYCDFSGYTDVARGVSNMFGLELVENFRRPYLARSTVEFWSERWHVSLGRWFRDYLYIPLGGSRAGPTRRALNVMIVFVASGLWHAGLGYGVGWTFLVWGALNGSYQWASLATSPVRRWLCARVPRLSGSAPAHVVRVLVTFHLVTLGWVFFRARSVGDALLIVRRLAARWTELPSLIARYPFTAEHYTCFGLIALLVGLEILDERRPLFRRLAAAPVALRWGLWYAAIFALLLLGRWQSREFIYMQF